MNVRGPQVCGVAGISYRQLDYWARCGYLRPSIAEANGSGTQRLYSLVDVHVAVVLAEMTRAGARVSSLAEVAARLQVMPLEAWPDYALTIAGDPRLLSFAEVIELVTDGAPLAIVGLRYIVREVADRLGNLVAA